MRELLGYNPADWYWRAADQPGDLWASGRRAWVGEDDAALAAWLAAGGLVTNVPATADVVAALTRAELPDRAPG